MVDRSNMVTFVRVSHARIDTRIDISISYDHQIWQGATSGEVDLNESYQASAGGVITSRSYDKLKTLYLNYNDAFDYQFGSGVIYCEGVLPI